jgi:hypothetical protein
MQDFVQYSWSNFATAARTMTVLREANRFGSVYFHDDVAGELGHE